MATEYMVLQGGEQFGPYSKEQIAAMLQAGNINASAMVWCEGWPEWVPVGKLIPPQIWQRVAASRVETATDAAQPKRKTRSRGITPWIIAAGAILIAVFVGIYEYGKSQPQPGNSNTTQPAVVSVKTDPVPADPKFTMSRKSDDGNTRSWWEIVNQSNDSLIIKSVTYNGEFSAKRGKLAIFQAVTDTEGSYPISIGLGETAYVMIYSPDGPSDAKYTKDIRYVDIDTNRGKFRYRAGGLTPQPD